MAILFNRTQKPQGFDVFFLIAPVVAVSFFIFSATKSLQMALEFFDGKHHRHEFRLLLGGALIFSVLAWANAIGFLRAVGAHFTPLKTVEAVISSRSIYDTHFGTIYFLHLGDLSLKVPLTVYETVKPGIKISAQYMAYKFVAVRVMSIEQ